LFRAYFGENTLLANIRDVNLENYRNQLKQKLTPHGRARKDASTNREMAHLHHVFTKAMKWDMLAQSPFGRGESLIVKANNMRFRYLEDDEIQQLLDECPDYLRDIVECALNTGMRRGEILSLKWDQINKEFIYLSETKTNEPRQVPINDDLDLLFKQIRKQQQLTSPYVFLYKGKPVKKCEMGFNGAVKRAGITDFHFHDLRHTFASHFVMRGGSLKELQEILGHATMTMTLRYAHMSPEHKKKAINLVIGLTGRMSQNVTNSRKLNLAIL
jgi:integrase